MRPALADKAGNVHADTWLKLLDQAADVCTSRRDVRSGVSVLAGQALSRP